MKRDAMVFASLLAPLVAFAESLGLERARVLACAEVSPDLLNDPDELVPYEPLVRIWRLLLDAFPSAPLGLRYASLLSMDAFGVVGYLVRHARNGHEAFAHSMRFSRLVDPFIRFDIEQAGGVHYVRVDHQPRIVAMVEPLEMFVLTMVRTARALVRESVSGEISFRHARRHDEKLYVELLGSDVPVRFRAGFDGASFDSNLLDLPLREAEPRVAGYLAHHAEALLERAAPVDAPLPDRVRAAIQTSLPFGAVRVEAVARALGESVRSLQRKLRQEGTSFSRELDCARRQRAVTLLLRPELTVAEVALMLGYAESSVFHRSFLRLTGQTPSEFRRAK